MIFSRASFNLRMAAESCGKWFSDMRRVPQGWCSSKSSKLKIRLTNEFLSSKFERREKNCINDWNLEFDSSFEFRFSNFKTLSADKLAGCHCRVAKWSGSLRWCKSGPRSLGPSK